MLVIRPSNNPISSDPSGSEPVERGDILQCCYRDNHRILLRSSEYAAAELRERILVHFAGIQRQRCSEQPIRSYLEASNLVSSQTIGPQPTD